MLNFISSNPEFFVAIISCAGGIIGLIVKYGGKIHPDRKWLVKAYNPAMAILVIVGLVMFYRWLTKPTVAILAPSSSIEVTAEGDSVWFSVSGTSSGVVSDSALMIYVLVYSDPEWHVQRTAMVEQDGRWALTRAWIGDASAPIHTGSQIRLMAVVSRGRYNPDDKFTDYKLLNPVAVSATVYAKVATIRGR